MSRFRIQKTECRTQNLGAVGVILGAMVLSGCSSIQRTPPIQVWPDMKLQARFEAQATTGLFTDGRASRRRPDGVIVRGSPYEEDAMNTGLLENGMYVGKMPVEVNDALLKEGEWRFNTYCAPCHDRTGTGRGTVPLRWAASGGVWQPADLTEDRVVEFADGDIFNVITFGRRTMPSYGAPNRANERWAIIAYVRVLQRAAHGNINEVPAEQRATVEYKGPPPEAAPATPAGATKQ